MFELGDINRDGQLDLSEFVGNLHMILYNISLVYVLFSTREELEWSGVRNLYLSYKSILINNRMISSLRTDDT